MLNLQLPQLKKVASLFFILAIVNLSNAQVGIGTTEPDASAVLELQSTEKGFLPPRMSTEEKNNIVNPATGLVIYNTTSKEIEFFNGTAWQSVSGGAQTFTITLDNSPLENTSIEVSLNQPMPPKESPIESNSVFINNVEFKGYFSAPNGQGTAYYDEDMQSLQNWDIEDDATLFAHYACNEGTCFNGASCEVVFDQESSSLNDNCNCTEGFTGDNCESIDACALVANPCQNGGTCVSSDGGIRCTCVAPAACACCDGITLIPCTPDQGKRATGDYCLTPNEVQNELNGTGFNLHDNKFSDFPQVRFATYIQKKQVPDLASVSGCAQQNTWD